MAWTRTKPSGKFQGLYRNADGKIRSAGTFTQQKQARREAERIEAEQRKPGALDLDGGKIRWSAWFDQWNDARTVAYATETNYRSTADNHIRPHWGQVRLDEIDQLDVNRWIKRLQRDGASPYTIRNAVTLFKTTLAAAVDDNRLVRNPARKVRVPDMPQATERYLTAAEVDEICFYLNGLNALIVRVATQTGMRFGEIAGLHWSRVDLDRGVIHVVEKYDQQADRIDPVPKDKERRVVPLTDDLVAMLGRHRDSTRPGHGTCGMTHTAGRCPGSLVFLGPRGAPIRSSQWGRVGGPWRAALEHAAIHDRVRPHDMRHTYASWMIQAGVPLTEIARVMGHSDTEITRRYAHLCDEGYDKIRNAMSGIVAARRQSDPIAQSAAAAQRQSRVADRAAESPRVADRAANDGYTPLYAVPDPKDQDAS